LAFLCAIGQQNNVLKIVNGDPEFVVDLLVGRENVMLNADSTWNIGHNNNICDAVVEFM